MKNKKLLSIIIPTHNSEKTIRECLSSIYCQLNKNIEVIVIDDGSTDKTVNVVKNKFSKFNVYRQNCKGVGAARNLGISLAQGQYIWFVDSDDSIAVNAISLDFLNILRKDYDLIIFGFSKNKDGNSSLVKFEESFSFKNNWHDNFENVFSNTALNPLWNKIYNKEIIKKSNTGFGAFRSGEDALFNYKIIPYTHRIYVSSKVLYNYNLFVNSSYKKAWNENLRTNNLERLSILYKLINSFDINTNNCILNSELNDTLLGEEINIFKKYKGEINLKKYSYEMNSLLKDYNIYLRKTLNKQSIKGLVVRSKVLSYLFIKICKGR